LGGGRKAFLPNTVKDFVANESGIRVDSRNLIDDWLVTMRASSKAHKFIWNASDLRNFDHNQYDHVFGIYFVLLE
jgi:hypothetical protein